MTGRSAISTLISARLHPARLPNDTTYPASVYTRIGGERLHAMGGPVGTGKPVLQLDHFAQTYSEAKSVATAFRQELDGFTGTMGSTAVDCVWIDDEEDIYEEAVKLYRVRQTYTLWHTET